MARPMRFAAWLTPLLLAGCVLGSGESSRTVPPDSERTAYRPAVSPVSDRHTSDRLEGIAPGAWVRYRVVRDGQATLLTLGAVSAESDALWIEVVEEGDPRRHSLRRVTFDGRVTRARCREVAGDGRTSEVAEQPVILGGEPRPAPEGEVSESTGRIEVDGRAVEATIRRIVLRDEALGKEQVETEAWSTHVPALYEGREEGGLVRRSAGNVTMELTAFGTAYEPGLTP